MLQAQQAPHKACEEGDGVESEAGGTAGAHSAKASLPQGQGPAHS